MKCVMTDDEIKREIFLSHQRAAVRKIVAIAREAKAAAEVECFCGRSFSPYTLPLWEEWGKMVGSAAGVDWLIKKMEGKDGPTNDC